MTYSIQFDDLSFSYENHAIVKNLNLTINKGQFVSIIGPSGCGKTTLFRLISHLEKPTTGTVKKHDEAIGYMPQKDLLMPWRSVIDNVILPLQCQGIDKKTAKIQATALLEEVGLIDYQHQRPKDLSGGMRQRVSFSRAMLAAGTILLLDEPFSALDALTKMELQDWLKQQLVTLDQTVVFITHDVEEAIYLSDTILVITDKPIQFVIQKKIPNAKERNRQDLQRPHLIALKEELLQLLKGGEKRHA
ncbi:ABC transporter ATP-binding protein [Kurthia sibirica]|uniref:ABC transporter ATP-binding protein n=1 Tax=Kurthia sibirica TaxID=202750 RepID=UPI0011725E20|nr:ABC transporter ATP-binding protein [Kurthia sibirica]GEK34348.1 ABC transporter ATP-binding protein [Kurthia sibirica]